MKVLKTGKSAGGVDIQIEEWRENYSFMPYGSTLAFYPESKATHKVYIRSQNHEGIYTLKCTRWEHMKAMSAAYRYRTRYKQYAGTIYMRRAIQAF